MTVKELRGMNARDIDTDNIRTLGIDFRCDPVDKPAISATCWRTALFFGLGLTLSAYIGLPAAAAAPDSSNTTSSHAGSPTKPARDKASVAGTHHGTHEHKAPVHTGPRATTAVPKTTSQRSLTTKTGTENSKNTSAATPATAPRRSARPDSADSADAAAAPAADTRRQPMADDQSQSVTTTGTTTSKPIATHPDIGAAVVKAIADTLSTASVKGPIAPMDAASLAMLGDAVRRELGARQSTTTTAAQHSTSEPADATATDTPIAQTSPATVAVSAAGTSMAAAIAPVSTAVSGISAAAVPVTTAATVPVTTAATVPVTTAATVAVTTAAAAVSAAATAMTAVAVAAKTTTAPPVANNDSVYDTENTAVTGNVLANDTAASGQTLTATLVTGPKNGTVTLAANGTFVYTPATGFTGSDSFTYVATAGTQKSAVATVTVGVVTPAKPVVGTMGITWYLGLTQTQIDEALDAAKAAGAISMRIDISWYAVGATKGTYDFSMIDPIVQDIVNAGLIPMAMIFDTPQWMSGSTNPHTPPANAAQDQLFAQFAAATAVHYAGIIQYFEVWNEENIPAFWTTPNAAAYTTLLKYTYAAIKGVEPDDFVMAGGLSPDSSGIAPTTFVTQMYANGAKGYFDALAYHWYAFPNLPTITPLAQIYKVMVANGDAGKQIWITEAGAPTGTGVGAVSPQVQAQTILTMLNYAATYGYIGPVFFYTIMDIGTDTSDLEDNFGLVSAADVPKPAYCALQQFMTGSTTCSV